MALLHMPVAQRNLLAALCVLAVIALIHVAELLINGHSVEYVEYIYASASVPGELDGYRFAFVSDLHSISEAELQAVARRIKDNGPRALFLGGDYASGGGVRMNMRVLASIEPPDGIFGVEGNHDAWPETVRAMKDYGAVPLSNAGQTVVPGLYVAGVRDLWIGAPDAARAAANRQDGDFVVLLSHNPDVAMEDDLAGVGLTLSGHTHGGQISLFGLWPPAIYSVTKYGTLFTCGYVKTPNGDDVIVSRGTGNLSLVPRVFARPQVYFITLTHISE